MTRSLRADPWETQTPVGSLHDKPKSCRCARERRPRSRVCLRKGCGRKYQPQSWNQRYCQNPACLREVRRWQAAKRQARHRSTPQAKARHAADQRARRQRAKSASQTANTPQVTAARGHAAKVFFQILCATGRGAMNRRPSRFATRHAIAVLRVVRRFAMFSTANASGARVAL